MRLRITFLTPLLAILAAACHKEGELVTAPEIGQFSINCFSTNADDKFSVSLDNAVMADSLMTDRTVTKTISFPIDNGSGNIVVKNAVTGDMLIDTLVPYAKYMRFSILSLGDGTMPSLLSNNELGENQHAWAFYYTDESLPDSLLFRLLKYRLVDGVYLVDTLSDEMIIKKARLSDYFIASYILNSGEQLTFTLKTADTEETIPGTELSFSGSRPKTNKISANNDLHYHVQNIEYSSRGSNSNQLLAY